ncbi:MAG: hypothetical protein E3J72_10260 [Planctomycetota bacterium]|nr:MAG: hypothetical protein E3J72_10260 [Planctomycetota bacterium]
MAEKTSSLFGMIAVEHGYLTKAVLDKLLSVKKQSSSSAPIGMLAVRGKKLTPEQVEHILSIQRDRRRAWLGEKLENSADVDFAILAMERGFLNENTVEKCIEKQKRIQADGDTTNFAEVCAGENVLTPDQLQEILASQSKDASICPHCGSEIDKETYPLSGEVLCWKCSSKLREEAPDTARKPTDEGFSLLLSGRDTPSTQTDSITRKPAPVKNVFDSSVKLFKDSRDITDLREKVSGVALTLKSRTAAAFSAVAPLPPVDRPKPKRLTAARLSPLSDTQSQPDTGQMDMETFREPSDHEFFLAALEEEAAMTESSGIVSTDALRAVMEKSKQDGQPGTSAYRADTQEIYRDDDHFDKTETQEMILEHDAWDKAAAEALTPAPQENDTQSFFDVEDELESFFLENDTDIVDLTPLSEATARRVESIDTMETSELLEHELPDSEVYDRAALIAADKIPASPPRGVVSPQSQWTPPSKETLKQLLSTSEPPGRHPSWRLPTQRPNWFIDNWLVIVVTLFGAGLLALVAYVIYSLVF